MPPNQDRAKVLHHVCFALSVTTGVVTLFALATRNKKTLMF
uniref:Uncharacterized protein n=1 Tax=Anguilla anguilla TaxID=7936 RepID=A0A0E9T8D9_ANGAN